MKPIRNKSRKRYFITGAGYCGTSLVAGALASHLDLVQDDEELHEHSSVVNANKRIIKGSEESVKELLDSGEAFKDPRFRLTLEHWLKECDEDDDIYLICCFRTTKHNAKSMTASKQRIKNRNNELIETIKRFCDGN